MLKMKLIGLILAIWMANMQVINIINVNVNSLWVYKEKEQAYHV